MKAVILAAGKSTRTHPITLTTPKVLLKIAGKSLLEHNMESLKGLVDEVILVVGFMKEDIQKEIGEEFLGMKVKYAEQKEQLGTGHALMSAEKEVGDSEFIVMMGDDIYTRGDVEKLIENKPSVLVQEIEDAKPFGVWLEKDGFVSGFEEKSENPKSNLANTGAYVLAPKVFQHLKNLEKTIRGEYELNEAVNRFTKEKPVRTVKTKEWIPVGYPWKMLDANKALLEKMEPKIDGEVDEKATLKGKVSIGKGTKILAGSYIEGPVIIGENCVIGPNAYIRPDTCIGNNCNIRAEVVDSIIMDNTTAKHVSYIGHSVVGKNVNIAAGTVTTDYRHDGKDNWTLVKGQKINTGRRKLGAFIGDNVMTGAGTIIYPGRKIWPGKTTIPGQVVEKDIE